VSTWRKSHGQNPVKRAYISQMLCFGRFLTFVADCNNSENPALKSLSEGKFRGGGDHGNQYGGPKRQGDNIKLASIWARQ
jgi:hypothetical protein